MRNYISRPCFLLSDDLAGTFGYHSKDVTVLKDHPDFPADSQPTRVNIVRDTKSSLLCHTH